jgi:hypothetical protein
MNPWHRILISPPKPDPEDCEVISLPLWFSAEPVGLHLRCLKPKSTEGEGTDAMTLVKAQQHLGLQPLVTLLLWEQMAQQGQSSASEA